MTKTLLYSALFVCQFILGLATFTLDDCTKDVEMGPISCKAGIPVYKWDQAKQQCVEAFYGGCFPSHNNFNTKEICEKYARPVCQGHLSKIIFDKEDCQKDVQEGEINCKAYIPVFKWDQRKQQCVRAIYGGCSATHNNFKSRAECEEYARPVCQSRLSKVIFGKEDCEKDVQHGPNHCDAYIPVFKWDQKKQKCVRAIYGGCGATHNNFRSIADCEKYARPVCQSRLSKVVFDREDCQKDVQNGPIHCNAYIPVFKWDQKKQQCVRAIYGGCGATHNNFRSIADCEKYARPVCQSRLSTVVFNREDCQKDVQNGPLHCNAYIPVFKWDQKKQQCVRAIYGGCGATHNNFRSIADCEKYARPVCQSRLSKVVFNREDCQKDVQNGPIHCNAYIPVFKWDHKKQQCVRAIYGGCGATHNNFRSIADCEKYARPVCQRRVTTKVFTQEGDDDDAWFYE